MSDNVSRLKELLFDGERATLTDLRRRIDQVFDRAGTEDRFRGSVATVLDGALRDATAPVEIQQSDDENER